MYLLKREIYGDLQDIGMTANIKALQSEWERMTGERLPRRQYMPPPQKDPGYGLLGHPPAETGCGMNINSGQLPIYKSLPLVLINQTTSDFPGKVRLY